MNFHPKQLIQKAKKLPPAAKWITLGVMVLFILTNLYHWTKVWNYPLFYYFPEHSFTVVDEDTGKPLEGVAAVYIYEMDSVYDGSAQSRFIVPALDPWVCFYKPSEWSGTLRIGLREGISDSNGKITIPSFGPVRRRRNHFFKHYIPKMYLFQSGCDIKRMLHRKTEDRDKIDYGEKNIVPAWGNVTIKLHSSSIVENKYDNLYSMIDEIYSRKRRFKPSYSYFARHLPGSTSLFYGEISKVEGERTGQNYYFRTGYIKKFKSILKRKR